MTKDEMIKELVARIQYNADQYDYYKAREAESENPAMWSELRAWYEGRLSAYRNALGMVRQTYIPVEEE